jgi:hypothetical protein
MVSNRSTSSLDGSQSLSDVSRAAQPKPEVNDAANPAGLPRLAFEDEYIPTARRLGLNEVTLLVNRDDAENGLIEREGT